jgi:hypothetical protein
MIHAEWQGQDRGSSFPPYRTFNLADKWALFTYPPIVPPGKDIQDERPF